MQQDQARIIIGHFGHSYGIKGWLKIVSYTDPVDNILQYQHWQIYHQGQWQAVELIETKNLGKTLIAKLAQCHNPEQARDYTNDPIAIFRQQLPPLPAQEYYWLELVGMQVINQQGVDFGIVDHLFSTGANDVMVVNGTRRRLLPYTEQVIQSVDLVAKKIMVDWDADF